MNGESLHQNPRQQETFTAELPLTEQVWLDLKAMGIIEFPERDTGKQEVITVKLSLEQFLKLPCFPASTELNYPIVLDIDHDLGSTSEPTIITVSHNFNYTKRAFLEKLLTKRGRNTIPDLNFNLKEITPEDSLPDSKKFKYETHPVTGEPVYAEPAVVCNDFDNFLYKLFVTPQAADNAQKTTDKILEEKFEEDVLSYVEDENKKRLFFKAFHIIKDIFGYHKNLFDYELVKEYAERLERHEKLTKEYNMAAYIDKGDFEAVMEDWQFEATGPRGEKVIYRVDPQTSPPKKMENIILESKKRFNLKIP